MVASWRPEIYCGLAVNADPNDPAIVPAWKDLTNQLLAADDISRGRQYELDTTRAGAPTLHLDDPNEYLNPDNTAGPYYPDLVPLRQTCLLAVWANPEAGNLINSGTWRPANIVAYDPSFESYTNGATAPNWLAGYGGTSPTVTTTNPQQGTKCVTYTGAATNVAQGVRWLVWCVPGRQYTTSIYVRQTVATAQRLVVEGLLGAYDKFTRTVAAGGWGSATTASSTLAYSLTGTAADYSVNGSTGLLTPTTTAGDYLAYLATNSIDFDIRADVSISALPATGDLRVGVVGRRVDGSNFYHAEMYVDTAGAITLRIHRRVAGVGAVVSSLATGLTYTPGSVRTIRFQGVGSSLRCKLWYAETVEPTAWDIDTTDTNLTSAGGSGFFARNDSAVTTHQFTCDNLLSLYSATSSTTTTTGSYVRLSVTWTAEQPTHYVAVTTVGANAGADTVNVDAVQHEPGASATAFTTTGSVVYPLFRGFIERWPSRWVHSGFRGLCETTAVDVLAVLANVPVHSELFLATMALQPDLYYPLWEPEGAVSFADVSGNDGPALVYNVSKYGAGTPPAAGTAINVIGDPGGVGVQFTPEGDNSSATEAATIITTGPLVSPTSPPVILPATISSKWAVTISAFFVVTAGNSTSALVQAMFTPPLISEPIGIFELDGYILVGYYRGSFFTDRDTSAVAIATNDGQPHHVCGIVTQTDGGNTTVTVYLDGVDCGTTTVTTASVGGILGVQGNNLLVGGDETRTYFRSVTNGPISHVAIWNRALTATEVATLWEAGGLGNEGELSGDRLARLFDAYYTGEVDFSTGRSVLSASSAAENTSLLEITQRIATTEDGVFWPAPDGTPTFESRDDRYLRLTPTYTFGELTGSGEYPYQGDIAFDLDPTFIENDVRVNRTGGQSRRVLDPTSIRRYFQRGTTIDVDLLYDTVADDYANWRLGTHKDPHRRVATITFNPATEPTLWPVILSIEIGTRVTVKRRAPAANNEAGLTVSYDFFVETVSHSFTLGTDQTGDWTTSLLLSPAGASGGYPQPWILDDATYSVLGVSTVLGF